MKSISKSLFDVRKVFRPSVQRQTAALDPVVRGALAQDVQDEMDDEDLNEVEQQLQTARKALAVAEEKERFIGVRVRHYKLELQERAKELEQQLIPGLQKADESDEEEADEEQHVIEHSRRQQQWERDQQALDQVIQAYKTILADCETIRRQIRQLERKRQQVLVLRGQCEEFLVAVSSENVREEEGPETELASLVIDSSLLEEGRRLNNDTSAAEGETNGTKSQNESASLLEAVNEDSLEPESDIEDKKD
jgi:hypothetical protein